MGFHQILFQVRGKDELICSRELVFGNNKNIAFPRAGYPQVKAVFDEIQKTDNHTLALRQSAGGAK